MRAQAASGVPSVRSPDPSRDAGMPARLDAAEGSVSSCGPPAQQPAGHFGDSTPQRRVPGAMPDADLRSHSSPGSVSSAQADEAGASGFAGSLMLAPQHTV